MSDAEKFCDAFCSATHWHWNVSVSVFFCDFLWCFAYYLSLCPPLVVLLIVPPLDSFWWFCLWYRMVEWVQRWCGFCSSLAALAPLDSLWWFCLMCRLWTHSTIRYHKQNHQSEPLDSLWWFCLWYRMVEALSGWCGFCSSLAALAPLDSLWWFCLMYRLWIHSTIRCHKQNHQSEPLDSLWWFCLMYRLWTHFGGFAYGTGWFQLGSVSASGLTLVVLLNIPPLDLLNNPVP